MRASIEQLLNSHDAVDFMQHQPPVSVATEIDAELARLKPEEAGERVGHYKLLEQIGDVVSASSGSPSRKAGARRVALKIVKLGMDTREVVARFEQERQALAMMDHPNIAKIFDAGARPTGRP